HHEAHRGDAELLYLEALALSRGGNVTHTQESVSSLLRRTDLSPALQSEALSLYGRTLKDLYERAGDDAARAVLALQSAEAYGQAFALTREPFPAVNAASMYRLAGKEALSTKFAALARKKAEARLNTPAGPHDDYWLHASLGEAFL